MIPFVKRNAENLLRIQKYVLPGTTMISYLWRPYFNISILHEQYHHLYVNHKLHFVIPNSGAHAQIIEAPLINF